MRIRLYQPQDRFAVRNISCDTADRGHPVENFFHDRKLIADLLINYYTDYEPQSLWVAEDNGEVIGYLTGCLDSRKYNQIMLKKIMPKTIVSAISRGIIFHKDFWRLIMAGLKTWLAGGASRNIPLNKYPAHLHINIQKEFRGKHIGGQLMQKFFNEVKQAGIQGIHLSTLISNINGIKFFEKMGFKIISRHPVIMPNDKMFKQNYTVIMGRET